MEAFVLINWMFCVSTTILLITLLYKDRYMFIKPSILVIIFFHIQIQWAAILQMKNIAGYLPEPVFYSIIVNGFPFIGTLGSFLFLKKDSKSIWVRITDPNYLSSAVSKVIILLFSTIVILISIFYFLNVSISETGLYSIVFNPLISSEAREKSLKLISNVYLKYSFSFLQSAIAPLFAVILGMSIVYHFKKGDLIKVCIYIIMFLFLIIFISIPGSRSPAASIILTIIIAYLLKKKMSVRPTVVILLVIVVFSIPVLLTVLREGKEMNVSIFSQYLFESILHRVFVVPMQTGLWHVHYAQTQGFIGIAGISKLAHVLDITPINVPNLIYLTYTSASVNSGFANTCYVFSYYCYFGIISLIFSLLGLWGIDLVVLLYKRLSNRLLLPCVASISMASISFISADYTTVLVTHGFSIILLIVIIFEIVYCLRMKIDN